MKHPLVIRTLQYPLAVALAIVAALVVVYPTYWERVATARIPIPQITVAPWTEQEREKAREQARRSVALPPIRLDQVHVGGSDMESMLQSLQSESSLEVRPVDTEKLPEGGLISDTIVHLLDQWTFALIEQKKHLLPLVFRREQYIANLVTWMISGRASLSTEMAVTATQSTGGQDGSTLPVASKSPDRDFAPSPHQVTVTENLTSVVLTNNVENKLPVAFLVNDRVQTLKPGESVSVDVDARVRFDRGGELGVESKTLKAGSYQFHTSAETGWRLEPRSAN